MPKGDKLKLKADPEDGTTPVANLLLEALTIANLNGTEKGLVLYLWRQTYGWVIEGIRQKEARIPQHELSERMGTSERSVYAALKALTDSNIFIRKEIGQGKGYVYRMNTDIATWNSHTVDFAQLKILSTGHKGVEENCEGSQYLLPMKKTSTLSPEPIQELASASEGEKPGSVDAPETPKESKKKVTYGEFDNVLLTKTEYDKLLAKFGEAKTKEFIENLSAYIASKGHKYKSHYATITNWDNLDKKKGLAGGHGGAHKGNFAAASGHYTEVPELPLD